MGFIKNSGQKTQYKQPQRFAPTTRQGDQDPKDQVIGKVSGLANDGLGQRVKKYGPGNEPIRLIGQPLQDTTTEL
jgi:hypothetical protein